MTETNKETLPLRVNPTLKKWVKKQAKKANKKVSPYVEEILNDKMKQDNAR